MENNPIYTDLSKEEIYRPEFNPSLDNLRYNSLQNSIMNMRQNNYNLFQGKNKNSLDFFPTGESLSDYSMPEYFSPSKENYDKFTSSPDFPDLGFSLNRDNEELYGKLQTTGEKISNGFSQMWELTKYQFKDQLEGWGRLFDFNPIGEDIEEVNERMDEIMNKNPIFMTEADRNSTFNWSKFSNIIGQTGFTLGMAGEILFEELVLSAANYLTLGALTPVQSARTAQLLAKAGSLISRRLGNTINQFNKVNNLVLDVNTARNIYKRMAVKGAEFLPLTNTIQFAAKGAKQGENLLQVTSRGFGSFYRDIREANAVFTEARAEASGTKEEVKQQLYEDYLAKYNREPSAQEMEKFEKISDEAMSANFITNSIIIGASNRIMFDNLLKGFKGVNKYVGGAGEILDDSKGYFTKGFNFRSAKAVLKTAPLTYFKNNITEAIQENLQSASNTAVKSWYISNYFDPNSKSVYASVKDGLKSQISQEGLDTFLAGFLTGSIAGPIQGGSMWAINRLGTTKEQRIERKKNIQDKVDRLNEFFIFNDKSNLPKQIALGNAMYDAVKSGSRKTFHDIKDETLRSLVRVGIETNKLDSLFDNLEESVKDLSEQEFKEAYPDIDKTDLVSAISEIKQRAESIKNIKEELDYKYPTDYSNTGFANTKAYEEAKWQVTFMQDSANRIKQRTSSLQNEIASLPELGTIPFSAFELLYKKDNLDKEIKMLSEQNKLTPDKALSRKIKTLELIKERGLTPALYKAFLQSFNEKPVSLRAASESFEKLIDIINLSEDEVKVLDNLDFIANPLNWKRFLEEHKSVQEELAENQGVTDSNLEKRFNVRIKRDFSEIPEIIEIDGEKVRARKIDLYQRLIIENGATDPDKLFELMKQAFDPSEIDQEERAITLNDAEREYANERRNFHGGKVAAINNLKKEIELAKERGKDDSAVTKERLEEAEKYASDPEVASLIEEYLDQIAINRLELRPELETVEAAKSEILADFPQYEIERQEEEVTIPYEEVSKEIEKKEDSSSKDEIEEKPVELNATFTPTTPYGTPTGEPLTTSVTQSDIEAKKADIERRRQGLNGVEEIIFTNPNFKLEGFEINGNYWNVVTSTDRAKVLVNINGVIVPFYLTTGQAGKGLVPGWYPFFGIGKDGWLNKTDKSDMETYYERYWGKETASIAKSISEELNGFYGTDPSVFKNDGDPNATSRPLSTLADKVEDYINSKLSYTPAINNADARKTLRSNVEQLGKEINAKYDAELDALKKSNISNPATTNPALRDVESKKADIERRRQEAKDNPVNEPISYKNAVEEYKSTELGSSENAKTKKDNLVKEAETKEGKSFVENQVAQLEHNDDGTITVYRSGTMQEGHNPATTSKKTAEIIASERKKQGLSSDIIEVRVNPSDISVVVPGIESEVFINVNKNNKERIDKNTKKEQKTKDQLLFEKKKVEDELEKTKNQLANANKAKANGTFEFSDNVYNDIVKKQEAKIKNLEWQLKKYDAELAALEKVSKDTIIEDEGEVSSSNLEEEIIEGSSENTIPKEVEARILLINNYGFSELEVDKLSSKEVLEKLSEITNKSEKSERPPRKEDNIPISDVNNIPITTIKDDIALKYGSENDAPNELTILNLKKSGFRVNEKGQPDINGKPIESLPIEDYGFFTSELMKILFTNKLIEEYKFFIFKDNKSFWEHYKSNSYKGPKFEKGTYNYEGNREGLVIFLTDKDGQPLYFDKTFKETTSDKGVLISFFIPGESTSPLMKSKRALIFEALSTTDKLELSYPKLSEGGWDSRMMEDAQNTMQLLKDTNTNFSLGFDWITINNKSVPVPEIILPFGKVPIYLDLLKDGIKYEGETFDVLGLNGKKIDFDQFPEYVKARQNARGDIMKDVIRKRIVKNLMNIIPAKVEIIDDTIMFNADKSDKWTLSFQYKLIGDKFPFELYYVKDDKIQMKEIAYSKLFLENSKTRIIPLMGKRKFLSLHSNKLSFELILKKEEVKKRLPQEIFNRVVQYLENQNIITEKICK